MGADAIQTDVEKCFCAGFSRETPRSLPLLDERLAHGFDDLVFIASIHRDEETGYHPPGTGSIQGAVNHELRHVMDSLLKLTSDPDMVLLYERYKGRLEKEVSRYAANHGIDEFIVAFRRKSCWTSYRKTVSIPIPLITGT